MNLSVLTLFPDLYKSFFSTSIIGRAVERGELKVEIRDFCDSVEPKKRIDAPPYGPGAGMLIRPNVVSDLILEQENKLGSSFRIFFSPHGKKIDQEVLKSISQKIIEKNHLVLVAPRYEGVDVRAEEHYADEILSVGDFVLMGGDIPALTFLEAFLRYVPGVVGRQESVENDSFSGPFVDYPHYTQPLSFEDSVVPDVLRSGNHQEIANWRLDQSIKRTLNNHFDWLRGSKLDYKDLNKVMQQIPNHYVALVHHDVKLPNGTYGTSSVTSIDVHDIARSATTYGISGYFVTTPLVDQQEMVKVLLDFWHSDVGIDYNPHRHKALLNVEVKPYLNDVVQKIFEKEGAEPIIIATSAQLELESNFITYHDQGKIWAQGRPVLLIFGTAGGLSKDILSQCDYLLVPITGMTEFNHLSVRSAAAIIFDRWLGLNPRTI